MILAFGLYRLLTGLGIREWLSALLTILFVISPTAILYENWLFYMYPALVLLVLGALFVHRFAVTHQTRDGFWCFALLAALCLLMSLLHLIWLLLFAAGLFIGVRRCRRSLLPAAGIPLLEPLLVVVIGRATEGILRARRLRH